MKLTVLGAEVRRLLYPEANAIQSLRPKTRAECINGERPCPWVGCKHHLYLTVDEKTGAITENFPDVEVWDLKTSCSLDVADDERDGLSLEDLGQLTDLTRERTRQIEQAAIENMDGQVDAERVALVDPPARTRQHRRVTAGVKRLTVTLLRLARQANSTSIRTFVAALEHARGLVGIVKVISEYLADDPKLDTRAIVATRSLACAAAEPDPMVWPIHLIEMSQQLAELDAALQPAKHARLTEI